jgi:hypothetical protein
MVPEWDIGTHMVTDKALANAKINVVVLEGRWTLLVVREDFREVFVAEEPGEHAEVLAFDALAGMAVVATLEDDDFRLPVVEVFGGLAALKCGEPGEGLWRQPLEGRRGTCGAELVL